MPVKDNDTSTSGSDESEEIYLAPSKIMHEDDPIFVRRYPTVFNRINATRVAVFGAVLTFALILITIFALLDSQDKIAEERNDRIAQTNAEVRALACVIVSSFPDSAAPAVAEIRERYKCPPFSGRPELPPPSR